MDEWMDGCVGGGERTKQRLVISVEFGQRGGEQMDGRMETLRSMFSPVSDFCFNGDSLCDICCRGGLFVSSCSQYSGGLCID